MKYILLLVGLVVLLQGRTTADTVAEKKFKKELDDDKICRKANIDRHGGTSAMEMHNVFKGTSQKALKMAQKFRMKLLKNMHKEVDTENDPVLDSCRKLDYKCNKKTQFRTADGSCNNLKNPSWGQSFIALRRLLQPVYDDGVQAPRTKSNGKKLRSARVISTAIHTLDSDSTLHGSVTHMTMQFAQFMDHDISRTPAQGGDEGAAVICCEEDVNPKDYYSVDVNLCARHQCFPITIPFGDPRFDRCCMNFVRSVQVPNAKCETKPVEQMNEITAYIDASMIYGSDQEEQDMLRTKEKGLLKISECNPRNLLPSSPDRSSCRIFNSAHFCFKAGDDRVNEQMGLTSMHTIWLREHNRVAAELKKINCHWDDERLFQETRKIVGAKLQHITYTEFLPVVLSKETLEEHGLLSAEKNQFSDVYDKSEDASVTNAFATAAFRFGHSLINSRFSLFNKNSNKVGDLLLRQSFGNVSFILSAPKGYRINSLTRGLVKDLAQRADRHVAGEIRDHLFEDENKTAMDLIALNIQRGRDHGLPGYNEWRKFCGLTNTPDIPSLSCNIPKDALDALKSVYRSVEEIDLFSGGLSETPLRGSLLGPTFSCILGLQFKRLKTGDRFWYETADDTVGFGRAKLKEIRKASLARVICDNTDVKEIQKRVFRKESKRNPLVNCADIPKIDLGEWLDPCTESCNKCCGEWTAWSKCKKKSRTRTRCCPKRITCQTKQRRQCPRKG